MVEKDGLTTIFQIYIIFFTLKLGVGSLRSNT